MAAIKLSRSGADTHGVRGIARQQIAQALESLKASTLSDETVHAARKELKKARATLRLLRDSLGDSTYKRENAVLRDAARPLSEVRDARVLLDTLDKLVESSGPRARGLPLDGLKRALQRERTDSRRRILERSASLEPQRRALRKADERAARWRVGHHGWNVIGTGLKRIYREGRKAFIVAQADSSAENLHEWRKSTKYLWHQLQILQPLWPGLIGELADQAHKLAEQLGDDHDLAVLRGKALENDGAFPNAAARSALIKLIDGCRTELREKAFVLGRRIYVEKPKAFEARFGQYWEDWQSQPGP